MRACLTIFGRQCRFWVGSPALLLLFRVLLPPEASGQDLKDMPSPDPNVFHNLPSDHEFGSKIEEALKRHEYERAETLLVEKIEQSPKSPRLLTLLGHIFFLDGKYLNSAVAMKKAEALSPLAESDRFTLAMAYIRLNHNDWAKPELIKLTESNPQKALYPYWIGRVDYAAQQFRSAVSQFRKALTLDPNLTK